ncbi:peptidyl-prolyl cis-trans isomerase [Geomonas nitrogeniifigens]|uniref:Peptidyl-prolyl cis-trans isomerase n=1 Tax=Geomonas diazotrophica TaxID=2843197 RepID=A0ABX8JIP3_9BACT|nr:peptidyl-prolyl cis-trans isomerase [Geomonas nitrogeniifigens]QWV96504.1 peptidyl-prolyl cis-trans isomerase [Geomonas nitrogeniifigens]
MKTKVLMRGAVTAVAGVVLLTGVPGSANEGQQNTVPPVQAAGGQQPANPVGAKEVATSQDKAVASEFVKVDDTTLRLNVPLYSPHFFDTPLAVVGEDKITVGDLQQALMAVHEKVKDEHVVSSKKIFMEPLQRLINIRLVVQEAKGMELDKLAEVKEDLDKYAEQQLRQVLFQDRVKDIKPDEKRVEKEYRQAIKEMKMKTALFKKEADAKKFLQDVKAGKKFEDLREKAFNEAKAEPVGRNEELFATNEAVGPVISEALVDAKPGTLTPVIEITNGYLVIKVEDVRYVESPEKKEIAKNKVLAQQRLESLKGYKADLLKQYAKENTKLIKSLDFDAPKPGFDHYLKDKRVVMTIKGEKPITVADLAETLQMKFFHGIENAIKEKKLNREKLLALDELESVRLFRRVSLDKGLDKSEEYLKRIQAYQDKVLFTTFVEKAVKPEVSITLKDAKDYYQAHLADYQTPAMILLDGIAFTNKQLAQSAADKLRSGVDFGWMKSNAEGQIPKEARGLLVFEDQMLAVPGLPEPMQKVLTGARKDDYKLYESPEGYVYVIYVKEFTPPAAQDFELVKNAIGEKISYEHLNQQIEKWFAKLREAYPVKIYLDPK